MFNELKKAIEAEHAEQIANGRYFIEHGYLPTWADEHKHENDNGIKEYSTARRWEQYNAGKISREKAIEYACKRMEKQRAKYTETKRAKLERATFAHDVSEVTISVTWKRNSTWGYNPTAEVTIHAAQGWETYIGSASGCGYDKETAAIGNALNQSASVLRMLYAKKETALAESTPEQREEAHRGYVSESNRNYIAYGAGYGVLPYFEGGVGMSSFVEVFNACGYVLAHQNHTKHSDYYCFERKEAATA